MNMFLIAKSTIEFNLTLSVVVATLFACLYLYEKVGIKFKSQHVLKVHYFTFLFILSFSTVKNLVPNFFGVSHSLTTPFSFPFAKIWSASSVRSFDLAESSEQNGAVEIVVGQKSGPQIGMNLINKFSFIPILVLLGWLFFLAKDFLRLYQWKNGSIRVRRIGKVEIYVSESASMPFSFWLPGAAVVVVPTRHLGLGLRTIMAHELQHHRQRDTVWIIPFAIIKLFCFFNPFFHLWIRWISELQEYACDETLVDRKKVESLAYARLLVEVAQKQPESARVPACAAGMAMRQRSQQIKRRIMKMLQREKRKYGRLSYSSIIALMLALVAGASYASTGWVQDRRVTIEEAKILAKTAQGLSDEFGVFPIEVNDLVLKQLNRFIGTQDGREFMRKALERKLNFENTIATKIKEYRVPSELMAVPIVESGFRNREQDPTHKEWGAGLWMFIETTARSFGLQVDDRVDERLNVERETDAAMRYLLSNQLRFTDWRLALMAYNIGEHRLENEIKKHGTRDPWILVRKRVENDRDYLPRIIAAVLIMRNPNIIR